MELQRTVTVDRPVDEVFDYLADFTTTTEWDPGTVRTTRESGSGGVGTRYRNVSRFVGRTTVITYVVTEHEPPHRLQLRGENRTVVAHDTLALAATSDGRTEITYQARFTFKGWVRLVAGLTAPAFRRLADEAALGLRTALGPRRP